VRPTKRHWTLALPAAAKQRRQGACVGLKLRPPEPAAREALSELMLTGYQGTVDDEGEDLAASVAAMGEFFDRPRPTPECSVVAWSGTTAVGGCFVAADPARGTPFVAYIVTRPDWKRKGVGRLLLVESLRRVARAGHLQVGAYITVGNAPSEALFEGVGFKPARQG
jgi:GNAT superfamily N-acetyltransferase